MPPRAVGPYEVLSVIGRGGVGTVYRARHRDTSQHVALKLLGPPPACDPAAARRLAREYEALEPLHHPNVVRVYEAGVHEGYSFLAMELVEGLDLRSYLSPAVLDGGVPAPRPCDACSPQLVLDGWSSEPPTTGATAALDPSTARCAGPDAIRAFAALMDEPETDSGPRPLPGARRDPVAARASPGEAAPIAAIFLERLNASRRLDRLQDAMLQVCQGLAYVHSHALVHRDLKPSNIMVDDGRRVRLMDFGLVRLASEPHQVNHQGKVVGTYRYMAPEQARGEEVDHRADLYSVGVILFELLCGRPPFVAHCSADLWRDVIARPAPSIASINPGVDRHLAGIAERLLAKDRRERFQDADEVGAAIRGRPR